MKEKTGEKSGDIGGHVATYSERVRFLLWEARALKLTFALWTSPWKCCCPYGLCRDSW